MSNGLAWVTSLSQRSPKTLARIAEGPHSYALWPNVKHAVVPIRRALVQRFPYAIGFEIHADQIRVLAVAHAKRRPLYWLARTQTDPI